MGQQLQQQFLEAGTVSYAEAQLHGAIVDEYAGQVCTIAQDIQGLQRCMEDLASHAEEQGQTLDNIEARMSQSVDQTQAATQNLLGASQSQRTGNKWICRLLVITIVLSLIIILVMWLKS